MIAPDPLQATYEQVPERPLVLKVERQFEASPEAVFDAWIDPKAACQWLFATPGGEMTKTEIDARVGGKFTIIERRGEMLATHFGTFVQLERPHRLAFLFHTDPNESPSLVTIDIVANEGGCELTLTHEMEAKWSDWFDKVKSGWGKLLQGLDITVSSEREIVGTKLFDASPEVVFDAWTQTELIARWWGPNGFTLTTEIMDVRPDGIWKFVMHGPDGKDFQNTIRYAVIERPTRLVLRHLTGPVFTMTVTFDEWQGKTCLTMRMQFETARDRDRAAKEFGAIEGNRQTLVRLEGLLRQLKAD